MIKPTDAGFEACIAGLGATLRCGYGTEDAAVEAGRRLGDQLVQRGWIRCEVITAGSQGDDLLPAKSQASS
ncbi:MAG TPA: hypothetical protein VMF13_22575 [Luteitalea sp.]|nr:hypothetical protein [Luteitalea sp.]